MARSKARGGRSTASKRPQAKATSRKKSAPVQEVEIVEEEKSGSMEDGIAVVTFIIILAAILFADAEMGKHYGAGVFFKGGYEAPPSD